MGRKPNAIVQEYFHRGQKLNDASNRYVHTCKRCGAVFPKGRVDSLVSHLLRRCPNIAQEDRHLIFDSNQQQNPDLRRTRRRADVKAQQHQDQHIQIQHHHQPQARLGLQSGDVTLPILLQREQSALDTLAEVSRRHLDYSTHHHHLHHRHLTTSNDVEMPEDDARRSTAERALLAQLQGNATLSFLPSSIPASSGPSGPSGVYEPVTFGVEGLQHVQHSLEPTTADAFPTSPLVEAASAANRQLEQAAQVEVVSGPLDPQLETRVETRLAAALDHDDSDALHWSPAGMFDREAASNAAANGMSPNPIPSLRPLDRTLKQRRRGQFTASRRAEVQEIRKRGACIRCRMLKKPCSEGTPCNTCGNVESARVWKSSCIRTRLADAFTLWSSGLYHARAKVDVPAAVHGREHCALPGRIEASFFPQSNLCMTFAIRKYTKSTSSMQAEDSARCHPEHSVVETQQAPGVVHAEDSSDTLLLDEGEGMSSKIEAYSTQTIDACIAAEPSLFLRRTLERARMLMDLEELEVADVLNTNAPRSCYNLQSQQLLKNVVELWVETIILSSQQQETLRLQYNATRQPCQSPETTDIGRMRGSSPKQQIITSHSKDLILAQLFAATEARCFALGKSVMNEIERRLLQRQQVSRFSTFISAIILLNCIERMTCAYRRFDHAPSIPLHSSDADGKTAPPLQPTHQPPESPDLQPPPHGWPLPESPRELWSQGEHFANLLIMLLRMRALPPPTTTAMSTPATMSVATSLPVGEAILVVATREHLPTLPPERSTNERLAAKEQQTDEQAAIAASWLNPLQLSVDELVARRDEPLPDHTHGVAAWDLKFISRVLLPEGFKQ